jgi:hypothetical protein
MCVSPVRHSAISAVPAPQWSPHLPREPQQLTGRTKPGAHPSGFFFFFFYLFVSAPLLPLYMCQSYGGAAVRAFFDGRCDCGSASLRVFRLHFRSESSAGVSREATQSRERCAHHPLVACSHSCGAAISFIVYRLERKHFRLCRHTSAQS